MVCYCPLQIVKKDSVCNKYFYGERKAGTLSWLESICFGIDPSWQIPLLSFMKSWIMWTTKARKVFYVQTFMTAHSCWSQRSCPMWKRRIHGQIWVIESVGHSRQAWRPIDIKGKPRCLVDSLLNVSLSMRFANRQIFCRVSHAVWTRCCFLTWRNG